METALPPAFIQRMRTLLGGEADAFLAASQHGLLAGLRVNLLKLNREHFEHISPWTLESVPWCQSGFVVPEDTRPGKHPYHAAGLYYLQEPSAMAVVEALQVRPGQRVCDIAAAPGGKATHIAALLGNQGLLVANEVEGARVRALSENLERWGARNVVITNERPERLAGHFGAGFDRVLLDAPCSGEGMFRKNAVARAEWSPEHIRGCAVRQARILEQAARLVVRGGLLLYSTCTFAPEENEQRIAAFLAEHPDWELVEIPKRHGFAPAQPEWAGAMAVPDLARAVRLWPHRISGEGHFMALLRNAGSSQPASEPAPLLHRDRRRRPLKRLTRMQQARPDSLSRETLELWHAFERETLAIRLPREHFLPNNDQLYLAPEERPDLGTLRVIRSGLWLGTIKPNRFEPSHALALALAPGETRATLDLGTGDVERYLHCETLESSAPDGWALMTFGGWPLGWGRRIGGTVKNFYPKGLRSMA